MRGAVEVHTLLLERGVPHEFFRLPDAPLDFGDILESLGLAADAVAQTSVFDTDSGRVLVVVSAAAEPDAALVAEAAGASTALRAGRAAATEVTDFPADWAPPLPHSQNPVLVDKNLTTRDVVYLPGGEPGLILKLRGDDLLRATGGTAAVLGH